MTLGVIHFGVGTFQFAVSLVPPTFKWIVEMSMRNSQTFL
jgi:hypothetical protein